LELAGHENFRVTLLSSDPNFKYYPAFYHTATGGSRMVSVIPLSELFSDKDVNLVSGTAEKLDKNKKVLVTKEGQKYEYDVLILALGVVTNYFGIDGLQKFSYGMKTLEEVEKLKAHLHQQMIDDKKPDLNYVVVGAGPSGVEMAGALTKYVRDIMKSHGIKRRAVHIDLIEAAPRVLPRAPKGVSRKVARRLRRIGVKLYLNKPVQGETADELLVGGNPIQSHTVIWTSGVTNHPFFKENKFVLNERGKVQVDGLLQAWPGIFVIGDNADTPFSGMAQTALHDAVSVAENLKRHASGHRPFVYHPKEPVYVFPAGPGWAAVVWGKLHIYGRLGWWLRRAADFIGYHDVEPWWKATRRVLAESQEQSDCHFCALNEADSSYIR
jgi:NADH dehydrogenase